MMKGHDETEAPKSLDAMSLDEIIAHRTAFLTGYQNARLAKRYRKLVDQVREAADKGGYGEALPRAVAINYAKLLAYKDEYEVARLFADGSFEKQLHDAFEGDYKISFNLAPPIMNTGRDPQGRPNKKVFGASMMKNFRLLAKMKGLRGTPLDIFGYAADRKMERDLIPAYEKDVANVLAQLSPANAEIAIELLSLARPYPRLRPGEGEVGEGSRGAPRPAHRRPRQPAAGPKADGSGVGLILSVIPGRSRGE